MTVIQQQITTASPLEQFLIQPLISLHLGALDFTFTNSALAAVMGIAILIFFFAAMGNGAAAMFIPNRWMLLGEIIVDGLLNLTKDNINGPQNQRFFPLIFVVFMFILISNLFGLVPYSFTITSHIVVTFALAFTLFVGLNIIGILDHRLHFLSLFLPAGTSLGLAALLVPLELLSYFVRVISLPVRLFANMLAGHALLKILAGFAWSMFAVGGLVSVAHIFPMMILFVIIGLELGVACLQAYVFTVLTCIYINDAINLH